MRRRLGEIEGEEARGCVLGGVGAVVWGVGLCAFCVLCGLRAAAAARFSLFSLSPPTGSPARALSALEFKDKNGVRGEGEGEGEGKKIRNAHSRQLAHLLSRDLLVSSLHLSSHLSTD